MQFKHKISIAMITLFLVACSNQAITTDTHKTSVNYEGNSQYFAANEAAISNINPFIFNDNGQITKAYLADNNLRAVKTPDNLAYFNSYNDYTIVVDGNVFIFAGGKLTRAFTLSNGEDLKYVIGVIEVQKLAYELYDKFSLNKADKTVPLQKDMPADVKLNYLCSEKVKQVKATKRFFRSGPNTSLDKMQNLTAVVRLNGSQFYNMDCKIKQDKVESLSLLEK